MTQHIFVFGSNLAGRHGKGSALEVQRNHGAVHGVGVGPRGNSYAIPTKDKSLRVLPLRIIDWHVKDFLRYASDKPLMIFNVVAIGCGLAGYQPSQIAPMFRGHTSNVKLPAEFIPYVSKG